MMVESRETHRTVIIPSRIEEIGGVMDEVKTYLERKGYEGEKYRRLMGALYEAVSNAISHGNKEDERKSVSIIYCDGEDTFQIKVKDEGGGFDSSSIANPCSPDNINKPRGRGIFIQNFVDEVSFNKKGNEITMAIKK